MKSKLARAGVAVALALAAAAPAISRAETSTTSTPSAKNGVNISCVRSAVGKREDAVAVAFEAFSASVKAAYSVRKSALAAAWAMEDKAKRKAAIKAAWNAFQGASKKSRQTWKKARLDAWLQFHKDRKACGKNAGVEELNGQGIDASL